ncbi:MAG: DUF3387 domain-containing protein [Thermoleophilia bacterium]|nr:DUF3387 domain-containing protein [Thermoleophilia bacterium]
MSILVTYASRHGATAEIARHIADDLEARGQEVTSLPVDAVTDPARYETIRRYQNRAIEAAQVIEELIGLARDLRELNERGAALDLSEDELAFYDALGANDSAIQVLGVETLRTIARELVATVRGNVTIDWTIRENVRAHLRVLVKRTLRKYGYPPDKQEKATLTILEQAEVLSEAWAVA